MACFVFIQGDHIKQYKTSTTSIGFNRSPCKIYVKHERHLGTETVKSAARALEGIDDIESSDSLPVLAKHVRTHQKSVLMKPTNLFACSV